MQKNKVLLMGRGGSGKTSMSSIIFGSCLATDTKQLNATIDVARTDIKFLGNFCLNIWDCGGQVAFLESYYVSQREKIFSNVEAMVYVIDVAVQEEEMAREYASYQKCLQALNEKSPLAKIFCLIHKIDLIPEDEREKTFLEHKQMIEKRTNSSLLKCFMTSIWNETLYRAWSGIVHRLIPNMQEVDRNLQKFADGLECSEVILFERETFLIVTSYSRVKYENKERFEQLSQVIKDFKLTCRLVLLLEVYKMSGKFETIEIRNSQFAMFVDLFTASTYIVVVMPDSAIPTALISVAIRNSKKHFEILEQTSKTKTDVVL